MTERRIRILVSACLMGANCRYDGGSNLLAGMQRLQRRAELIPFCPEIYGGLATPRQPSEIRERRVFSKGGGEVTAQFEKGAAEALKMAELLGCRAALLKERSPSCGSRQVYDGTFTGRRIPGRGITAGLLLDRGITVFSEEELEECISWVKRQTDS